ncbi:MAG: carboxymuconolactone decarboxylase family protein [Actinomyces sp.]|nr:MAG: carboxymuconolactone decarboxylase family protein [Actinomyces sp.]
MHPGSPASVAPVTSRPSEARLAPLTDAEIAADPEATRALRPFLDRDEPVLAIFRTLARHPDLLRRWLVFANHILGKSTLDPRDRELAILRIGWLCRAPYEWGQHVLIGRGVGVDDADLDRIRQGPDAEGWTPRERTLLRAVDELHADACIGDATWADLSADLDERQCLDLIFTVGQYQLVSMALNTCGVQPDEHLRPFPLLDPRDP